ncbi:hypothetical protein CSOJ01_02392 [Colletotrichum sojae]|uniref:Uncharacterized protein n=1 Tax=Colletotrichum sojae TaxID=2175907 RepID=A0A8H6JRG4_9PEZI|nr:hypothetical protein CSOJ01_02392 [Colletotrichum sojae]
MDPVEGDSSETPTSSFAAQDWRHDTDAWSNIGKGRTVSVGVIVENRHASGYHCRFRVPVQFSPRRQTRVGRGLLWIQPHLICGLFHGVVRSAKSLQDPEDPIMAAKPGRGLLSCMYAADGMGHEYAKMLTE